MSDELGDERHRSRLSRSVRWSTCVVLAGAVSVLVAACGGSSSTGTPSAATGAISSDTQQGVHAHPARGVAPVPPSLGAGKVIASPNHPVKAREQQGAIDDEVNSSGAKRVNPCTLVTRAEASTILGKPVGEPVDAPQGPTCVYTAQGSQDFVTLALQAKHFSTIKAQAHLHDRISLSVGGHNAYCGVAGTPTLIVPLSAGRFLSVVAPCPIAASFAAKALNRIA